MGRLSLADFLPSVALLPSVDRLDLCVVLDLLKTPKGENGMLNGWKNRNKTRNLAKNACLLSDEVVMSVASEVNTQWKTCLVALPLTFILFSFDGLLLLCRLLVSQSSEAPEHSKAARGPWPVDFFTLYLHSAPLVASRPARYILKF